MNLSDHGYAILPTQLDRETLQRLCDQVFEEGKAGKRCLLDEPLVRQVASQLREEFIQAGILPSSAKAIQAIAFDKTPGANWKVSWHQDLMFPFAQAVTTAGFDLPSRKDGIDYARPPREVLENLLAVRLHLDECDATNGPLRVAPGSHRHGILKHNEVADAVARHGEVVCLVGTGSALLMKPLLLHASSQATAPKHRRVVHFVYDSGEMMTEDWHRAV